MYKWFIRLNRDSGRDLILFPTRSKLQQIPDNQGYQEYPQAEECGIEGHEYPLHYDSRGDICCCLYRLVRHVQAHGLEEQAGQPGYPAQCYDRKHQPYIKQRVFKAHDLPGSSQNADQYDYNTQDEYNAHAKEAAGVQKFIHDFELLS